LLAQIVSLPPKDSMLCPFSEISVSFFELPHSG
jgi:hypothetical protein